MATNRKNESDCRKTRVPAAGTIVAHRLDVDEKFADQFGIHVLDPQVRRRLALLLGGEAQQQAKRVTVPGNRIRTGFHLGAETVYKEPLQQSGKGRGCHRLSSRSRECDTRFAASSNNSGTASIYQYV